MNVKISDVSLDRTIELPDTYPIKAVPYEYTLSVKDYDSQELDEGFAYQEVEEQIFPSHDVEKNEESEQDATIVLKQVNGNHNDESTDTVQLSPMQNQKFNFRQLLDKNFYNNIDQFPWSGNTPSTSGQQSSIQQNHLSANKQSILPGVEQSNSIDNDKTQSFHFQQPSTVLHQLPFQSLTQKQNNKQNQADILSKSQGRIQSKLSSQKATKTLNTANHSRKSSGGTAMWFHNGPKANQSDITKVYMAYGKGIQGPMSPFQLKQKNQQASKAKQGYTLQLQKSTDKLLHELQDTSASRQQTTSNSIMKKQKSHDKLDIFDIPVLNESNPYQTMQQEILKTSPADIEKMQNSIIKRFLSGEITKDQAQKLDLQLQLTKKRSSLKSLLQTSPRASTDSSQQKIITSFNNRMKEYTQQKQRKLQEMKHLQKSQDPECSFKPNVSTSQRKSPRKDQRQENNASPLGQEFEAFYDRQVSYQKRIQENKKQMYEQAEKELIECLSQRDMVKSRQRIDSIRASNNTSAINNTTQRNTFDQTSTQASQQHGVKIGTNNKKDLFEYKKAKINKNDVITQLKNSERQSVLSSKRASQHEKRELSTEFLKRLASPMTKTYREKATLDTGLKGLQNGVGNSSSSNLFRQIQQKKSSERYSENIQLKSLRKDIDQYLSNPLGSMNLGIDSELNKEMVQDILLYLLVIDRYTKNITDIVDEFIKDLQQLGNGITLDAMITFFTQVLDTNIEQTKQVTNLKLKYRMFFHRREDNKRFSHKASILEPSSMTSSMDCSFTPSLTQRTQVLSEKSRENSAKRIQKVLGQNPSPEKSSKDLSIYDKFKQLEQVKCKQIEEKKQSKVTQIAKECTFRPKINQSKSSKSLNTMDYSKFKRQSQRVSTGGSGDSQIVTQSSNSRQESYVQLSQQQMNIYKKYQNNMCSTIISEKTTSEMTSQEYQTDQQQHIQPTDIPLLHVDIRHGVSQSEITRLSIFEGDNVLKRVKSFGIRFSISQEVQNKLIEYIQTQIQRLTEQQQSMSNQNMMQSLSDKSSRKQL